MPEDQPGSAEKDADLAERIKAVIDREVYCVVVVRSEHHAACPGGGPDCARLCPVPVQDYGDTADLARAIADELARPIPPEVTEAGRG